MITTIFNVAIALFTMVFCFKAIQKHITSLNRPKVNLFTWKINPELNIVDADEQGKKIPVLLKENFNLHIPLYCNTTDEYGQSFIEHEGKIWLIVSVAQLEKQINIFVLECGSSDPKKSPLCVVK